MAIPQIPDDLLVKAINESRDGITITDARGEGYPLIYVNTGFEQITGFKAEEVLGRDARFLQGEDAGQPGLEALKDALSRGEGCTATVRNYRKNGEMFWNELSISPVHDATGKLTHFIAIMKDETARVELSQHLKSPGVDMEALSQRLSELVYTDPLVGISNRRHFDERFTQLLAAAQRMRGQLSVLMVDIDRFTTFNSRYGQSAGDECLRIVGEAIAKSFSRSSDCVARYSGALFAVVSLGDDLDELQQHAVKLCTKVRALGIPHGDSPHGVVTVSVGGVSRIPHRDVLQDELIKQAELALYDAKHRGRDLVHIVS